MGPSRNDEEIEMKRPKLGYLVTHPIQYQAPLLRKLAASGEVDLTVLFLSDMSLKPYFDRGFGAAVDWQTDLLSGYKSVVLQPNTPKLTFWSPPAPPIGKALKEHAFDCLWVHGYAQVGLLRGLAAAKMSGLKILFRGEGHRLFQPKNALRRNAKAAAMRFLASYVDAFLAIGALNRDYYASLGVVPSRIFDVPYAVDNDFFREAAHRSSPNRAMLRSELGMTDERPVILYASKLQPHKRALDLLEAYIKLSPDGRSEPAAYLVFIGDGEQRTMLEERAKATGWNSIRLLGFKGQGELPSYYDLCDVFVLPSEREPWGLVVNEVMNAGRPIVCTTQVGAAYDLVEHGRNGYVYEPGNVEMLAGHLSKLIESPAGRAEMGKRSLERISRWGYDEDIRGIVTAVNAVVDR
jgi:glycosyltransferase involved in cell wall biosynthesis